jgi:hypothetical protein
MVQGSRNLVRSPRKYFSQSFTCGRITQMSLVHLRMDFARATRTERAELLQPELGLYRQQARLSGIVYDFTKIPSYVLLQQRRLSANSVAARMSWAAHRTTKRSEDMTYCLLGIFDVNMPLIYGEGTRAFPRLQEEIIKRSNDLTIFAWDTYGTMLGVQGDFVSLCPVTCCIRRHFQPLE